jgi:oxalate decarboxylase/phosphoglucose isomerase-like protein (cupin superfamily)
MSDVGYVRSAIGHYVANVGDEPVRMLELLAATTSQTCRPTNRSG